MSLVDEIDAFVERERCTCRDCLVAGYGMGRFAFYSTPDERLARVRKQFLEEPVRWGPQTYTPEWLESEVDAILGVTHQRYLTRQMRTNQQALDNAA